MYHKINFYLSCLCALGVYTFLSSSSVIPDEKPNIIFIIADDMGYDDYGFMGHKKLQTPNLDRLAKESMTFTKGYVTAPMCSPSLASIISGLYPHQHRITGNDPQVNIKGEKTSPNNYAQQRDLAYQTLSNRFYRNQLLTNILDNNDYQSFQAGKWWIGAPQDAGFSEGMTHGDYKRGGRHGDEGLKIAREGMLPVFNFIEESKTNNQPFFLWYAPYLPHKPHNPPKDLEEKYKKIAPSPQVAKYWAMVEWFDQTTGELLNYLKEKDLEKNTIIVYVSDNGWIQSIDKDNYAPRSKRSPYEYGIRTPLMFKYPRQIQPKVDTIHPISTIDIIPTLLNLIDIEKEDFPGINVLDQNELKGRRHIFAEAYKHDITDVTQPTSSILYKIAISKKWKLIYPNQVNIIKEATTDEERIAGFYSWQTELYDLENDPDEEKNVAAIHPDIVKEMIASIDSWWQPL